MQSADSRPGSLYTQAVRAHWLVVLLVALVAVGAAAYALRNKPDEYRATAEILVTPFARDDQTFSGLGVIRESGEPTRTIQTAAALFRAPAGAELAAQRLGPPWTSATVLGAVAVQAKGESDILSITATAEDPETATRVADTFSRSVLDSRRRVLERQLDRRIAQLRAERDRIAEDDSASFDLGNRLNDLLAVRSVDGDPSLELSQPAGAASVTGSPDHVILLLAAIAGLALGSLAAFGIQLINRRIRHEEEMLRLYPLPVLARVPRLPRRHRRERLGGPSQSPPAMREAFRTLRLQIEQRESGRGTIMVTSGSAGDGKTTVVANLAFALAQGGFSVIALDLDVRKPQLGSALQVPESRGMTQLLTNRVGLASVLVDSAAAQGLRVLPAHERDAPLLESLLRRLPSLLAEAEALADYVILDTPPLGEVSDALTLASEVDTMLLVVRLGHTNRRRFEVARDLLARAGAAQAGLVVIGDALEPSKAYYGHDDVAFLPVNAQAGPR